MRVLRKLFGSEWEDVTAGRRIFCNDDFYNLYSAKNNKMITFRSMRWARRMTCMEEKRNELRVSTVKFNL